MELRTDVFSAIFSIEENRFVSLRNLVTGDEYIKETPRFPLISVFIWESGKKKELQPQESTWRREDCVFIVEYTSFGGRDIWAALTFEASGSQLLIRGKIKNNCGCDIVEVLMPHISGISLGNAHENNILLYPHHAGEKTQNPVKQYRLMAQGEWGRHWRAACMPRENYYHREINYCGLASMSWMYLQDAENGFYIGSHDDRFPVTGIIAQTSGNERTPWMGFAFRKFERICTGDLWETGVYCLAITDRDWHYGAEIYRAYIMPLLNIQAQPAFLKEEFALHQCYNFKHSGRITRRFTDIPAIYEKGAEWNVRHLFIASWNRTGFDSSYPEYYPDMDLGSAMQFRRGLEYVKERGGFSTLYINARIFDVTSDFHNTVGQAMALRTPEGDPIEEIYGPAHFTVNCPGDSLWQNHLIDIADFTAMAYGCNGIYLDQLGSAEPYPCYEPSHSHGSRTGEFNRGYLYILQTLLTRLRARNPEAYLMTENCGDIYSAYCWGNLTWNGDTFDEFFNLFKFTFPEYVQVNMVDPRGWESDPNALHQWFYKDMQRAILLGSILWLGITDHLERHSAEYRNYARRALEFRKNIQKWIRLGRYCDDLFVQYVSESCDASCWTVEDNRVLLLAGNYELRSNARVEFCLPSKIERFVAYDTDWNELSPVIEENHITLPLDGERLFCILAEMKST